MADRKVALDTQGVPTRAPEDDGAGKPTAEELARSGYIVPGSQRAREKALGGPTANKSIVPGTENKAGDEGDALASVDFASAAARDLAAEEGLTADSFRRQTKSSDSGFTKADVERIAAKKD